MHGVNLDCILVLLHAPPPEKKLQEAFWKLGDLNKDQLITRQHWGNTINFLQYDNSNVITQRNNFTF